MFKYRHFEPDKASPGGPRRPSRCWRCALAVAAAILFGTLSHQGMAQEAIGGDKLRSLISGNTLEGSFLARRLVMVFYADGQLRGSMGGSGSDSGTWEVNADTYCNEWARYFDAERRCYQWIPDGDGYLLKNVDAFKTQPIKGRITQGKPKGY